MNRTWLVMLCQLYTLLVLLGVSVTSQPPRFLPILVLLVLVLATTIRPLPSRFNLTIYAATILLTPLVLTLPLESRLTLPALVIQISAVVAILPVFYLLDHSLRQNTLQTRLEMKNKPGIYISGTFVSLLILALIVMFISLVVGNRVLLYTGTAVILYLAGIMLGIILTINRSPLSADTATVRIIAGNTGDMSIEITNNASARVHCQFGTPEPWLKIVPLAAILKKGHIRLNLNYMPPLAGNSHPQLHVIAKDLRGFVQICQVLEPLVFEIIPRARYAEWLAQKYLQQAGAGVTSAGTMPQQTPIAFAGGIEYRESRDYQPGDQMKDIDWKHTLRSNQLIVKDYSSDDDSSAIIAVNLSVANDEEADNLAYNLVTAALTLARENVPAALTAYSHQGVVLTTGINEPNETLRQALSLMKDITRVESITRYLEPADIAAIRRNITRLKRIKSGPAQKLLSILDFEYHSIEENTRSHPATIALTNTAKQVPAPATILLISQLNHDAEAIKVITEKLTKRFFNTIPVVSPVKAIPR